MSQCIFGTDPLAGVPVKAPGNKVQKLYIRAFDDLRQVPLARVGHLPINQLVGLQNLSIKEQDLPGRNRQHVLRGQSKSRDNVDELVKLRLPRPERVAGKHLHQNAAKTPHINRRGVRNAQYDLRGPVEPALNISVQPFRDKARRAEVNQLDRRLLRVDQQNVFRLQVTMNDVQRPGVVQGYQDLLREAPDETLRDALKVVQPEELVQVHTDEFKSNADMVAEQEVVLHPYYSLLVLRVVFPHGLQHPDLDLGLLVELLLVLDHFDCDFFLLLVVEALADLAEAAPAEEGEDLVPVGDVVALDQEVVGVAVVEAVVLAFEAGRDLV